MATELASINYRETAITLTPSDSGRFEIYMDGQKLYDRMDTENYADFLPAMRNVHKIRDKVKQLFVEEPAKT